MADTNIEEAMCLETAEDANGAGNTIPVYVLLLCTFALLLLDLLDVCGALSALPSWLLFGRAEERTGRPGDHDAFCETTPTTPSASSVRSPAEAEEASAEVGSTFRDEESSSPHDGPTKPKPSKEGKPPAMTTRTWVIIALTALPSFAGDLYFSMLAPFLPGAADARGLTSPVIGVLFACVPIGAAAGALGVPWLLQSTWGDPYALLRRATLVNAALVACTGLAGNVPLTPAHGTIFAAALGGLRIAQGLCCACMNVATEAIMLMLLPRVMVGPVTGVLTAARILAVIAGPVVGGFLYQVGCWALPFTAGAVVLLVAALALTLGLGRTAPTSLRPRGQALSSPLDLLCIGDMWLVALPTVVLSMVAPFLEPTWQLHLGAPPFALSPQKIGVFLQFATLEYLLVLVAAGFILQYIGPSVQIAFGALVCTGGMLLLGPSPLLHAWGVPQTHPTVLTGAMVTFGGIGAAIPALTPMALEVCERHGYTQKQVAGVNAGLSAALAHISNILGPLLGGALRTMDGGFPMASTLYGLVGGLVCTFCCARLLLLYCRRPDAGCFAARRQFAL